MNGIPKRVTKDVSLFAVKHGIRKVILFGSRARGNHTERSDVDIAVSGGDFDAFSLILNLLTMTIYTEPALSDNSI